MQHLADVTQLPDVETSDNIILEEDRKVKDSEVTIEHLRSLSIGYTLYSLKRGMHVAYNLLNSNQITHHTPLTCRKNSKQKQLHFFFSHLFIVFTVLVL